MHGGLRGWCTYSDCGQGLEGGIKLGADWVLNEEVEQVLGNGVGVRCTNDLTPPTRSSTPVSMLMHREIITPSKRSETCDTSAWMLICCQQICHATPGHI